MRFKGAKLYGLAVLGFLFCSGAAKAEVPNYDVEAGCKRIASLGGGSSQVIEGGCLQQEQAYYDAIKPVWDNLDQAIKAQCDHIARVGGGGSYVILHGCIEQELQAAKQNKEFKFKR